MKRKPQLKLGDLVQYFDITGVISQFVSDTTVTIIVPDPHWPFPRYINVDRCFCEEVIVEYEDAPF
jgi:hypothetical protein